MVKVLRSSSRRIRSVTIAAVLLSTSLALLHAELPPNRGTITDSQLRTLRHWETRDVIDLAAPGPEIVVLDFFAYWCAPCLAASRDIELNIARYYESPGDDGSESSVQVHSVNVESDHPERTRRFIQRSGVRSVLFDENGRLLESLGGLNLPFIAVLRRASGATDDDWEILYRSTGYEGHQPIRSAVDLARAEPEPGFDRTSRNFARADPPAQNAATINHESEFDFEVLRATDIALFSSTFSYRDTTPNADWNVALLYSLTQVDYEPFSLADVIGRPTRLEEQNHGLQLSKSFVRSPFLTYQLSGGGYGGFTDHTSLWLDEYYRQQFSGLDGYEIANPWGYNFSSGVIWDTRSRWGIIGASTTFQQDDVAPGYDRPLFQELERGRARLHTGAFIVTIENVLTRHMRSLSEFQVSGTTDRELRFNYRSFVNTALGEHWVVRTEGAYTSEATSMEGERDFHAHSYGLTVEYDWNEKLFVGFHGRRYRDNGQIETSILVSSGPPPLETEQYGGSVRWQGERFSGKIGVAAYRTRFGEVETLIRPFGNLYRNRSWVLVDLSASYRF